MEIKEWNLYTKEEKKQLLKHWWYYYGKLLISFEEIEEFNRLLDTNIEDIYASALMAYLEGLSSQVLISAMRQGRVEELFNILPKIITEDGTIKEEYKLLCDAFLNEVVSTLNNPEPSIPMSDEEIIRQL